MFEKHRPPILLHPDGGWAVIPGEGQPPIVFQSKAVADTFADGVAIFFHNITTQKFVRRIKHEFEMNGFPEWSNDLMSIIHRNIGSKIVKE